MASDTISETKAFQAGWSVGLENARWTDVICLCHGLTSSLSI
jgi:hypothetical protein